ncbi:hypothetical protein B0A48_04737 [Cryoendolithus antarcticus]|uniref:Gem-associated protein 5 TPR domain-containing protein n=1 Tax=Cryoendolithus antarcticus TaxID=1507870 RepID=A0A1V8TD74_9PEZI|nr:hypothetical protein B0A48_04737 [Cryoendolithus antarcticus]
MSIGQRSHSKTSSIQESTTRRHTPPLSTLTPENSERQFEPSASTGSFLLYAQRNVILVLHHDTLVIERRFELHREEIRWIAVDNVSERGAGRLAVSFDAGQTTIVWDILTGREVTRFVAYEDINVACFMRNGNVALGNVQGGITLFEPSTNEHFSARTIFDPITAIAPCADNRTFAIGYLNGSILIATLQPAFTILHTLTTSRAPSRIAGLAWHGSSSKQKTDMLATQTADGDLRVWSVPKAPHQEPPTIIRALGRSVLQHMGPAWFAWSKNGRILQYFDGETRSWDVRTKKVTYDVIPTIDGVTGIANYGPTATLFTFGHNHTVQQYDVNPSAVPLQVTSVQHAPANTPPTPPTNLEEQQNPYARSKADAADDGTILPTFTDNESSADESTALSPMEKIAKEMETLDQLESEIRDKVMPLSPTSSRASSVSSKSSGGGPRHRNYLYDRPSYSRTSSNAGYDGTEFSFGGPSPRNHDSMSIRSGSTRASNARFRASSLRKEVLRSPEEMQSGAMVDLFPFVKARLRDVAFRTPHYGTVARTPEVLQREMLSVVFGWNEDTRALVRDELARHRSGSASSVLLAKWLGDTSVDSMASMVGSQSMTSSDWMLMALSAIGQDSQKVVGETFVQRLLEKGDVHPAVAILLGLGEYNDAIEVYVSQGYHMEAVLLTCLHLPTDWGRQSHLLRKWGEVAVQTGSPELAVRIFSCTSVETSEAWFSPRAQDAVYTAQQQIMMGPSTAPLSSPPLSPPSRSASGRLAQKNATLKLITTFGAQGTPVNNTVDEPTPLAIGITPILNSAMSPRPGDAAWLRNGGRSTRAPSSARTATPGYARRKRLPSSSDIQRATLEASELETPITAARNPGSRNPSVASDRNRRTSSVSDVQAPATAIRPGTYDADKLDPGASHDHLPSPARGAFPLKPQHHARQSNPDSLTVQIIETRYVPDALSPGPSTHDTTSTGYTTTTDQSRTGARSPAVSMRSAKSNAIDAYINSVEQARATKRQERADSRARAESRRRGESRTRTDSRASSTRVRDRSEARSRQGVRYIKPAKASPSSPVPMSPSEIAQASSREAFSKDAENYYAMASPTAAPSDLPITLHARHFSSDDRIPPPRVSSRPRHREVSEDRRNLAVNDERGRSDMRGPNSTARSPSAPLPQAADSEADNEHADTESDGRRVRVHGQSASRPGEDLQTRRAASRSRVRERSGSRQPKPKAEVIPAMPNIPEQGQMQQQTYGDTQSESGRARGRPGLLSRKDLAAKELEERRLSLARRPSAPAIPLPGDLAYVRPNMSPRSITELGNNPRSYMPPVSRSHTADPEQAMKYNKIMGTSTPSAPIGLPATPRAMRHPRYMSSDPNDRDAPPVPMLPDSLSSLSGSSLSQITGSNLGSNLGSNVGSNLGSNMGLLNPSSESYLSSSLASDQAQTGEEDGVGPLLPSTVFGMKGPQGPTRAASAPPEKSMGPPVHHAYNAGLPTTSMKRLSAGRGVRKISPPENVVQDISQHGIASIDHALHAHDDHDVIIIGNNSDTGPVMLPELQHLAMPPPPPPPPTLYQHIQQSNADMIQVGIEGNESYTTTASNLSETPLSFPYPMDRASTTSPSMHRRDRGSVSDTFSSRMRGVADRMRSNSRSRTKSPQTLGSQAFNVPYETVLPPIPSSHQRRASINANRAKSPYEQAMADQQMMPPPPPPPPSAPPGPGMESRLNETTLPPRSTGSRSGYRNPKEIRANMPPEQMQPGAMQGGFL